MSGVRSQLCLATTYKQSSLVIPIIKTNKSQGVSNKFLLDRDWLIIIAELPDHTFEHPLLTPMLDIIPALEDMLLPLPIYA
ncbi:hypothetical protein MSj_00862 [Microcystis aeruginosa Sj]|uniref:Uncharacterized protein n=1 Tax=Microcystis aeruginosa Sj TaxID=1979544 RepID=A0A2Z6UP93_MICAE|nr:hypothetical protein MSj_00862 [Microcystis aeruginosa Sj]